MRLGGIYVHSNEILMQEVFSAWIGKKERYSFRAEVRVREVKRIADFLLVRNSGTLINVEAKSENLDCLLKQMADHATYCDYSFALISDYCVTPRWFKEKLLALGYGLIVFNEDRYKRGGVITEALEAHHNKNTNMDLRNKLILQVRGIKSGFGQSQINFDNDTY